MKKLTITEIILALVVIIFIMTIAELLHAQIPKSALKEFNQVFYTRMNEIRAEYKLSPVTSDHSLERASKRMLKKMIIKFGGRLVHEKRPGESEVLTQASDPIKSWMNSPGHRRVLLSPKIKEVGLAYVDGYFCMKANVVSH